MVLISRIGGNWDPHLTICVTVYSVHFSSLLGIVSGWWLQRDDIKEKYERKMPISIIYHYVYSERGKWGDGTFGGLVGAVMSSNDSTVSTLFDPIR